MKDEYGKFDFTQAVHFVELLGDFRKHIQHANAIKLQTDRYLGRTKAYSEIENYGILFGITENSGKEIPVLYEVKNLKSGKDKLYLVALIGEQKKSPHQGFRVPTFGTPILPVRARTV